MSEVTPRDILYRIGGKSLLRGVLATPGPGRSTIEVVETFTRADASTCATFIDRDGILRLAAANKVRIEWVDLDGDGIRETPGILLEGSRTNSCLQSETFGTTWVPTRASVSSNADTAPDGTVTADRLIEDATAGATHPIIEQITITANENISGSVFVKAGTRSWIVLTVERASNGTINARRYFNLATGALGTASGNGGATLIASGIVALGNGWYRCYVSGNLGGGITDGAIRVGLATGDGTDSYNGDGASYVSLWGGQFERGAAFPSSYIKTVAATVTRAADSLTLPVNWGPIDQTWLTRVARPVHADATGDIGAAAGPFALAHNATPQIRGAFSQSSRVWSSAIDTAGTDTFPSAALIAGAEMKLLAQFRNLTTGGLAKVDAGAGFGSEGGPVTAFSAFGNQTLRVGAFTAGGELYGVLIELFPARGLFTLSEMLAASNA